MGYAGKNGRMYTSIGRELIKSGALDRKNTSMQSIRKWLGQNPEKAIPLLRRNKSYVFFRELGSGEVTGALGVALVPGRSIAVDARVIPMGIPIWLDSNRPNDVPGKNSVPLRRLMVAHDTGSAIIGGVRGDVFWGYGKRAEHLAGNMKHFGRWFLLLPRQARGASSN